MSINPTTTRGQTEGPLGFPMLDRQARALDARLRQLPADAAHAYRRCTLSAGTPELLADERADVSWITAEAPDRAGDIVRAAGMDDSQFALNPVVTLNHDYDRPPVGRSLWRKQVRAGALHGVRAKTLYPPRPEKWSQAVWPPDDAFQLVKAGLLLGKSVGFLPVKVRTPTDEEIRKQPEMGRVRYIIEEWLLLEYACCYLPAQPNAVVEQVSKCYPAAARPCLVPFTPLEEYEAALHRRLDALDLRALSSQVVDDLFFRLRGAV